MVKDKQLTQLEKIQVWAGSRLLMMDLNSLPCVPAPKFIDKGAVRIFNMSEFQNWHFKGFADAGYIEYFAKRYWRDVTANMRRYERWDDRYAFSEDREVD